MVDRKADGSGRNGSAEVFSIGDHVEFTRDTGNVGPITQGVVADTHCDDSGDAHYLVDSERYGACWRTFHELHTPTYRVTDTAPPAMTIAIALAVAAGALAIVSLVW